MTTIDVGKQAGSFAEDKDVARDLRVRRIESALKSGREVILDFSGVELATQSFIHALVSDIIRRQGATILDRLIFKSCNDGVKNLVRIVTEYSQEMVE